MEERKGSRKEKPEKKRWDMQRRNLRMPQGQKKGEAVRKRGKRKKNEVEKENTRKIQERW